ncbi:MAG: oxidoreductase [Rhizobiales bacterium NRL2]|jgi:2,4-dienoyl-CoA reductase-like NADH-dependent reductase (Old Yellow Enzyme family)|nr:MAG: oxidoreductase [Rhizobiales bacterium NRL2]
MSALFSEFELGGMTFDNRVVVSPMCQYLAEDGSATDWHLMHLGNLAMSGAGLLIIEATHVSQEGRITHNCLGLYSDENEAALTRAIDFCRRHGTAKLGIQVGHAGRKASTDIPLRGGKPLPSEQGAWQTIAPSALPYAEGWHTPRAFQAEDFARVREEFVQTAVRAARIGFDLFELHGGHGYLLHQFLSPISNQREDAYGGDLAGRMRFPLEVFDAVRSAWPHDRPLGIRLSATDWVEGGWTPEETVVLARELKSRGCDFIDVTTSGLDPRQQIPIGPGYQVPFAEQVRREAEIPTMAVGMITEPQQAEAIIAEGRADFVMLARGMMYDPRWAWHAAEELGVEIPYPAQYARAQPSKWPQAFAHRRRTAPKAVGDARQL